MLRELLIALVVATPFGLGLATGDSRAPGPVFRFEDPDIVESSGLAFVDGLVATVNDSGDEGRVFAVDPRTGRTVGVTRWEPEPDDVEALAPSGQGLWVGDIGDNPGDRETISVFEVPVGPGDRTTVVDPIRLRYPEGARDAEALLVHPATGRMLVVTKDFFGGEVFEAPAHLSPAGVNRLRSLGRVATAVVTDGAFFPDGDHLVLRNYGQAAVYSWPRLEELGRVDLPEQQQGEGIAVSEDGRILISSEGKRAPVHEVALSPELEAALAGPSPSEGSTPSPSSDPVSREGAELPEEEPARRDPTQWLIGTGLLVVALLVLLRALRPDKADPPR